VGVLPVIRLLFDTLVGHHGGHRIVGGGDPLVVGSPGGEGQRVGDAEREVAAGEFGEAYVVEVFRVPEVRVGVSSRPVPSAWPAREYSRRAWPSSRTCGSSGSACGP
jgi:class 3 adenylate cyclase